MNNRVDFWAENQVDFFRKIGPISGQKIGLIFFWPENRVDFVEELG